MRRRRDAKVPLAFHNKKAVRVKASKQRPKTQGTTKGSKTMLLRQGSCILPASLKQKWNMHLVGFVIGAERIHQQINAKSNGLLALSFTARIARVCPRAKLVA
jgi:hypothetical protein